MVSFYFVQTMLAELKKKKKLQGTIHLGKHKRNTGFYSRNVLLVPNFGPAKDRASVASRSFGLVTQSSFPTFKNTEEINDRFGSI